MSKYSLTVLVHRLLPLSFQCVHNLYRYSYLFFLSCTTENCLLRFIQLALLDSGGNGRMINTARARELGASVEICE
jgi:hypothetical protein